MTVQVIQQAEAAGFSRIVLTVNSPGGLISALTFRTTLALAC